MASSFEVIITDEVLQDVNKKKILNIVNRVFIIFFANLDYLGANKNYFK
jgi:hypothetical protein